MKFLDWILLLFLVQFGRKRVAAIKGRHGLSCSLSCLLTKHQGKNQSDRPKKVPPVQYRMQKYIEWGFMEFVTMMDYFKSRKMVVLEEGVLGKGFFQLISDAMTGHKRNWTIDDIKNLLTFIEGYFPNERAINQVSKAINQSNFCKGISAERFIRKYGICEEAEKKPSFLLIFNGFGLEEKALKRCFEFMFELAKVPSCLSFKNMKFKSSDIEMFTNLFSPGLFYLSFQNCEFLASFNIYCPSVAYFRFMNCKCGDLTSVLNCLPSALTYLDISGSNLSKDKGEALIEVLSNFNNLEFLNLTKGENEFPDIVDDIIKGPQSNLPSKLTALQTLKLSLVGPYDNIDSFFEFLAQFPKLKCLYLNGNLNINRFSVISPLCSLLKKLDYFYTEEMSYHAFSIAQLLHKSNKKLTIDTKNPTHVTIPIQLQFFKKVQLPHFNSAYFFRISRKSEDNFVSTLQVDLDSYSNEKSIFILEKFKRLETLIVTIKKGNEIESLRLLLENNLVKELEIEIHTEFVDYFSLAQLLKNYTFKRLSMKIDNNCDSKLCGTSKASRLFIAQFDRPDFWNNLESLKLEGFSSSAINFLLKRYKFPKLTFLSLDYDAKSLRYSIMFSFPVVQTLILNPVTESVRHLNYRRFLKLFPNLVSFKFFSLENSLEYFKPSKYLQEIDIQCVEMKSKEKFLNDVEKLKFLKRKNIETKK